MGWLGRWRRRDRAAVAGSARPTRDRFSLFGGRRYLNDVPYFLPKDDTEINRLDFQHYLMRAALQGNYAAPIGQPHAVLDVGCGTGRWAMEMAAQFPAANVVGLDVVSPEADVAAALGHGLDRRPDNYVFLQGSVLDGLPFQDARFDFTHQRLLVAAIPADRWQGVVNDLLRVTRPGGWIELVEAVPAQGGPAMNVLRDCLVEVSLRRGVNTQITYQIGKFLEVAGARNVAFRELNVPLGRRGDRVSAMMTTNYFALYTGLRAIILAQGITSAHAYDAALEQARTEIAEERYIWPYYAAYGQRP
jgi:ubiquinone/menaquinone biosynthesis C-methylase UbiE